MNEEFKKLITEIVTEVCARAGFALTVEWRDGGLVAVANLQGTPQDLARLIGRDGQNLKALEHLVRVLVTKKYSTNNGPVPDFILDANSYRQNQNSELVKLAQQTAQKVLATGRAESLPPMNSFERRVVHTELAKFQGLATQSIGAEPNRRIVIKRAGF